jgi:hypothetical protein
MLTIAIAALVILGAGIVLESFTELARLRRLSRAERLSWLEAPPAAPAAPAVSPSAQGLLAGFQRQGCLTETQS